MPSSDFVKGACQACGGHIEFPASAIGTTVACPHCGQSTKLTLPVVHEATPPSPKGKSSSGLWLAIALVFSLGAAAAVLFAIHGRFHNGSSAATPVPAAAVSISVSPAVTAPDGEVDTNEFAILPFKLEKTPGSSLVYVVGTIRNLADRQRFGIKVTFGLFDTNDSAVGTATDYQQVLEPKGEWKFKAMVMTSKTTSAEFNSIVEDQ